MIQLVATFKPQSARGWSHYARILLKVIPQDGNVQGEWKWLHSPFFPFSAQTPTAKSGAWFYTPPTSNVFFFTPGEGGKSLPVMMFWRVPENFPVMCSHHDVPGKGAQRIAPDEVITDAEKLIWVMGPGMGRPKKWRVKEYDAPVRELRDKGHNPWGSPVCSRSCSGG